MPLLYREGQSRVALSFQIRLSGLMETPLAFPALHASHAGIWMGRHDGQVHSISKGEAAGRAAETPMVMLNAPLVAQRLGYPDLSGLDLLELYAFVYPARFAVPTPKGLAKALGLDAPATDQEVPIFLLKTKNCLRLQELLTYKVQAVTSMV